MPCAVQPGGGRHNPQQLADALLAVTPHLRHSNQQWLQRCLDQPLLYGSEDGVGGVSSSPTVYLLGCCFYAPLQHELVAAALQQLQPDEVLIEQPPPPSNTGLLLPHPQWVQAALDHAQCWQQQDQQQLQAFESELAASAPNPPAKVGKDIMDPYETFGYYGGLEYGQRPAALARVLQRCGFLPGREVVTAVQHALQQGDGVGRRLQGKTSTCVHAVFGLLFCFWLAAQPANTPNIVSYIPLPSSRNTCRHHHPSGARLRCIDAPLKLQESWVRGLVGAFTSQLDEAAVNSYQPLKDFTANQTAASTHLPDAAAEWDKALADVAAHLQQQQQQQAAAASGAAEDASTAAAAAAAAQQAAEQEALLLFKVSKATAAALLPPDDTLQAEVLSRMQRLQPLKWRHFALRQQHMAQQIKEAAMLATKQSQGRSSSSSQPTLLVVVGRQHCAALHAMWSDPASALWATQVPRSFAPSVVEPQQQQGADAGVDNSSGSNLPAMKS